MPNFYKRIFTVILLTILCGCDPKPLSINQESDYTICLGEFNSQEEAEIFRSKTDFRLWRELKIVQIEENRFVLLFGSFKSSYDAGEKAFDLLTNHVIDNYKIFYNNDYTRDNFANIIFIAHYQSRPSLYSFNLISKKYQAMWSRWGRKVITVNHSYDRSAVFITTALSYGKVSGLPYLKDARLNYYSSKNDRVDEIAELGTGLQLYTYWENKDTFKINLTFPDSLNSEIIRQKIIFI